MRLEQASLLDDTVSLVAGKKRAFTLVVSALCLKEVTPIQSSGSSARAR